MTGTELITIVTRSQKSQGIEITEVKYWLADPRTAGLSEEYIRQIQERAVR